MMGFKADSQDDQLTGDNPFGPEDIICKTPKGFEEARKQTSESSMPRRLRSLLMVVDGKSPFRTYAQTLKNHGDVEDLYASLEQAGYISRIPGGSQARTPAPAASRPAPAATKKIEPSRPPAATPRAPAHDPQVFAELVSHITTVITDSLGGDALELLLELESAETPDDLVRLTPVIESHLSGAMDRKSLKKFISSVRSALI